jgi:ABC-type multidrug transport system fused ATPase/permease subunit
VDNGKIVESGTFQELLKNNKTVQNLAALMAIDSDR